MNYIKLLKQNQALRQEVDKLTARERAAGMEDLGREVAELNDQLDQQEEEEKFLRAELAQANRDTLAAREQCELLRKEFSYVKENATRLTSNFRDVQNALEAAVNKLAKLV